MVDKQKWWWNIFDVELITVGVNEFLCGKSVSSFLHFSADNSWLVGDPWLVSNQIVSMDVPLKS